MNKYYIAGIVRENTSSGGGYSVYFPDLPQVAAGGETIEEALHNAASGLYVVLRALAELNADIPEPSPLEEAKDKVRAERAADGLPCPEDTVYQYIAAPELDMVPVRINISLAKGLLAQMDKAAALRGMTRSGLLAAAAQDYISRRIE